MHLIIITGFCFVVKENKGNIVFCEKKRLFRSSKKPRLYRRHLIRDLCEDNAVRKQTCAGHLETGLLVGPMNIYRVGVQKQETHHSRTVLEAISQAIPVQLSRTQCHLTLVS